mmetsp:Transcript_41422/g.81696  ORF Transcript_41422/g.81696 Transcript_41422/m.81696 type:complete len:291 (-) Transcript_41422:266-1138(-)
MSLKLSEDNPVTSDRRLLTTSKTALRPEEGLHSDCAPPPPATGPTGGGDRRLPELAETTPSRAPGARWVAAGDDMGEAGATAALGKEGTGRHAGVHVGWGALLLEGRQVVGDASLALSPLRSLSVSVIPCAPCEKTEKEVENGNVPPAPERSAGSGANRKRLLTGTINSFAYIHLNIPQNAAFRDSTAHSTEALSASTEKPAGGGGGGGGESPTLGTCPPPPPNDTGSALCSPFRVPLHEFRGRISRGGGTRGFRGAWPPVLSPGPRPKPRPRSIDLPAFPRDHILPGPS